MWHWKEVVFVSLWDIDVHWWIEPLKTNGFYKSQWLGLLMKVRYIFLTTTTLMDVKLVIGHG
jgi:hypothetical protein